MLCTIKMRANHDYECFERVREQSVRDFEDTMGPNGCLAIQTVVFFTMKYKKRGYCQYR